MRCKANYKFVYKLCMFCRLLHDEVLANRSYIVTHILIINYHIDS